MCCNSWVRKELDMTEWLNWTERYPCSNPCSLWIRPFMAKKNFADMIKLRLWRYKITLYYLHLCVHTKSHQSCSALCDPMDCSLPNSSVHGILQARILEWLPFPSPGYLPNPGIAPLSPACPALAGKFFNTSTTGKPKVKHTSILLPQNSTFRIHPRYMKA